METEESIKKIILEKIKFLSKKELEKLKKMLEAIKKKKSK